VPYPKTKTVDVIDKAFGVTVPDPYRWLENDVREDADVATWVAQQNEVTSAYLKKLQGRKELARSMEQLFDYDLLDVPVEKGGNYFYERRGGDQNQPALYVDDDPDADERVLIDPNNWSDDDSDALAQWVPSDDGTKLLYAVQKGGSDWRTLKVMDVASGTILPDSVEWVKFSAIAWVQRGAGFIYSRFPEPKGKDAFQSLNLNHSIYYHSIGTDQADDRLLFATPEEPELNHVAEISSDKRFAVIYSSSGTDERYRLTLLDLTKDVPTPHVLVKEPSHDWRLIDIVGNDAYFITNLHAPRLRIVKTSLSAAQPEWIEVLAEGKATIDNAVLIGDRLVVNFMNDAQSALAAYTLDGKLLSNVPLSGIGQISGLRGKQSSGEGFFAFESFNRPRTIYRYDVETPPSIWARPDIPFQPEDIVVTQRFYKSKDGTRVPMFLVHHKDVDLAAGAPTLLYGYGGFNVSLLPAYSSSRMAWIKAGGIYAQANLRGGGEYGKAWHDAGRLHNKQNVFDDFIAAGEYLISEGLTPPNGLAIDGRSNGGLLVGAVINQRPDLFAAGHAGVGVMDMLRFHKFTAGRYWVDDYGSPDKEADFRNLLSYSPYHNIREGSDYPAIIVSTADTDDRVVPGHSFKYVARLQAAKRGDQPHLIRVETRAGHGAGKPTDKIIEEYADIFAFLAHHTGLNLID